MSERVKGYDISLANLNSVGPGNDVEIEIPIPAGAKRWSLMIKPLDDGTGAPPGGDPTGKLQYAQRGAFADVTPGGGTVTFPMNTTAIVTREDVVPRVKLVFTLAADPQPNQGILIDLNIVR